MNRTKSFLVTVSFALALTFTLLCCASYEEFPETNFDGTSSPSSGEILYSSSSGISPSSSSVAMLINPTFTIVNNTGYTIYYFYMKQSTSHDWGSLGSSYIYDGQSRTITLSQSLPANSQYDFKIETSVSGEFKFIKYRTTISNNMTITFTAADLNDESDYPSITVQNRTGADFNGFYIKPSASADWGKSFNGISNNSSGTAKISISPSSYREFDIQMRSSNPTNTYTMTNVTITNGMVLRFTRDNADNPFIGSPIVVIENNTGYSMGYLWIKHPTSTDWGSDVMGNSLPDGQSKTITLPKSLADNNIYDIRIRQNSSSGYMFIKYRVTISDGMVLTFDADDSTDERDYPSITIQNRAGVAFNGFYIKPSVSEDWGKSLGSISNNSNGTATIPIPPSNYTVFDIQVRSTNPTNTYTMTNITITDSITLMFTRANADLPLIGNPVIVIENNTGYSMGYLWMKFPTSTNWGSDIMGNSLPDGQSKAITLSQSLSANSVYDIQVRQNSSSGFAFVKYGVTVSDGMVITFTGSDLEE